jgi:hypothetical protein
VGEQQGAIATAPVFLRWARLGYQAPGQGGGRVPEVWADVLARDPWMRDVVMVIELVFGGIAGVLTLRIATEPVQVRDSGGVLHDVLPLLISEPEVQQEYTLGEGTSSARSMAISLDGRILDAPALLARGGLLSGFGEVSLLPIDRRHPGTPADYDRRYVLLRGDLTGVRFGAGPASPDAQGRAELAEIEVVDPKETIGTKLPPWVVDTVSWANVHESGIGERYPVVVNGFDTIPAVRITSTIIGSNDFAFVYGSSAEWNVDLVYVNGIVRSAADPAYAWTVIDLTDGRDVGIVAIRFTVGGTTWGDSDAVHVSISPVGDSFTVIGALREVLERYSPLGKAGSSAELYSTAEARMGVKTGVEVLVNAAGGGNAASALEWAENGYCAGLPMISMVWENGSYGPVVTDRRLPPLAHWHVGRGVLLDRDTLVQESDKAAICNEFVLRYDYNALLDVFEGVIVRGPENSDVCRFSQSLVGVRHAEPMDAPYITDGALAAYVVDWLVDHKALPSYVVDYVGRADVLLRYRRGDRIDLTDDEMQWSRVPATIEAIRYQRGRAVVTLRVWLGYLSTLDATALSVGGG